MENGSAVTLAIAHEGICLGVPPAGVPLNCESLVGVGDVEPAISLPRNGELKARRSEPFVDEDSSTKPLQCRTVLWPWRASLHDSAQPAHSAFASPCHMIEHFVNLLDGRSLRCQELINHYSEMRLTKDGSEVHNRPRHSGRHQTVYLSHMSASEVMTPMHNDNWKLMCRLRMHQNRGNAGRDPRDRVHFGRSLMRYHRLRQGGDCRSHPIQWIVHLDCSIAEPPDAYPPPISNASVDLAFTESGGQRLISADHTTLAER